MNMWILCSLQDCLLYFLVDPHKAFKVYLPIHAIISALFPHILWLLLASQRSLLPRQLHQESPLQRILRYYSPLCFLLLSSFCLLFFTYPATLWRDCGPIPSQHPPPTTPFKVVDKLALHSLQKGMILLSFLNARPSLSLSSPLYPFLCRIASNVLFH